MTPAKVNVLIAQFAYGGTGGVPWVLPSHTNWIARLYHDLVKDERVDKIAIQTLSDTPITMSRNRVVKTARDTGYDFILMLDSDNTPDIEKDDDPAWKPFWQTSFDFAYGRLVRGLPSVVCAPYCGIPPHENVYVFQWQSPETSETSPISLEQYTRNHAAIMAGIQPVAAGPTGVTLYSTTAFDLQKPPWFYYEYNNDEQTAKSSTEDVTNFRDIALLGHQKYGEPVLFCNWDSWAGHAKVKTVRKPRVVYASDVNARFREAIACNLDRGTQEVEVDFTDGLDPELLRAAPLIRYQGSPSALHPIAIQHVARRIDGGGEDTHINERRYERELYGRTVHTIGINSWLWDLEQLKDMVHEQAKRFPDRPLRILEVGSWVGESAIALCAGFGESGGHLTCVDSWEGSPHDLTGDTIAALSKDTVLGLFRRNTVGLPVTQVVCRSPEATALVQDRDFDLIFIDAGHTYSECAADLQAWFPFLAPDGIMAGHDYCGMFRGVIRAVDEFCSEVGVTPEFKTASSVWSFHRAACQCEPQVAEVVQLAQAGAKVQKAMVLGKVVEVVGNPRPVEEVDAIAKITELVAQSRDGVAMRAVEVGTWVGETAVALAEKLGDGAFLYCVEDYSGDTWTGWHAEAGKEVGAVKLLEMWHKNTLTLPVRLLNADPISVAKLPDDAVEADLVFLNIREGDNSALVDLWLKHLAPYGFLCGDNHHLVEGVLDEKFLKAGASVRRVADTSLWIVSKQEYEECMMLAAQNGKSSRRARRATPSGRSKS